MNAPLRLLVFDRTCRSWGLGLSTAWAAGARLYRAQGRVDYAMGVASFEEAFAWLDAVGPERPIGELQFWGHGRWGRVRVGGEALAAASFRKGHPHEEGLRRLRRRFVGEEGLLWLRTCEAFGARAGHDFARSLSEGLGVRVAGHTFIIGALQSGLRALAPGRRPSWDPTEGLKEGTPERPISAHGSTPQRPRTVTCFDGRFPAAWFDEDSAPSPRSAPGA